jgi:hypothetical protein
MRIIQGHRFERVELVIVALNTIGQTTYTSVCSVISSASSTSMPRYRTVLSSFE